MSFSYVMTYLFAYRIFTVNSSLFIVFFVYFIWNMCLLGEYVVVFRLYFELILFIVCVLCCFYCCCVVVLFRFDCVLV